MFLGLLVLALAGCASVDRRIEAEQAYFDSLAPDDQEAIRSGQVAPGFTEKMVRIALGEPDEKYITETAEGEQRVWFYTRNVPLPPVSPRYRLAYGPYGAYRYWGAPLRSFPDTLEVFEVGVTFEDDEVVSVFRSDD
jgi:outer membrane protein assembly factor BamE (lipoprotein component of BamABCDE complex)